MPRLLLLLAFLLPLAACNNSVGDAPEARTNAVAPADAGDLTFTGTALPIVPDDSTVTWIGAKLTGNHIGGFRSVTGAVYVDGTAVTGADVRIDATTIYSDSDRLTGHLQSADFFEVETYPEARFQTNTLRPVTAADSLGDDSPATHIVTGHLTMHGQTNEVTFPATIALENGRATVEATFLINRTDWGINYAGARDDLINEQVRIALNVSAGGEASGVATDSVGADA